MSLASYFRETRQEMKLVVWPRKNKIVIFTLFVIVFSAAMAYVLGGIDTLFIRGLGKLDTAVGSIPEAKQPSVVPQQVQITPEEKAKIEEQLKNSVKPATSDADAKSKTTN